MFLLLNSGLNCCSYDEFDCLLCFYISLLRFPHCGMERQSIN